MPVTDTLSDTLTVIRNGVMAKKKTVMIKRSKLVEGVLSILKRESFIENFKPIEDSQQGQVKVYLKYGRNNTSALKGLKRISKPGLRIYVKSKEIRRVYGGIGAALISTPKGIMTDQEARKNKLGGEILCHVW